MQRRLNRVSSAAHGPNYSYVARREPRLFWLWPAARARDRDWCRRARGCGAGSGRFDRERERSVDRGGVSPALHPRVAVCAGGRGAGLGLADDLPAVEGKVARANRRGLGVRARRLGEPLPARCGDELRHAVAVAVHRSTLRLGLHRGGGPGVHARAIGGVGGWARALSARCGVGGADCSSGVYGTGRGATLARGRGAGGARGGARPRAGSCRSHADAGKSARVASAL